MSQFKSCLAPYINGLIAQKRAMGYTYEIQEVLLLKFDSMLTAEFPDAETVTKEIADRWGKRKPHEKTGTVRNRMVPVAHLAQYMNQLGYPAYVFPTNSLGKEEKYTPYIFTDDELSRFFHAVDTRCHYSSEVPYRQYVMPAMFRTIYCCGLRPGEVRRLKYGDVDLDRGVITIHASKYDADREVPLSASLWELLREYTDTVHKMTESADAPFFPGFLGKEITTDNMNTNFRRFLRYAGISHGGPGKGPRIYDFRHTFAVNTLKTLILRGENMNAYYPLLKTYMGHSFFKYTEYYLRLTKSMFPDICERMTGFLEEDLPIWEMEDANEEAD